MFESGSAGLTPNMRGSLYHAGVGSPASHGGSGPGSPPTMPRFADDERAGSPSHGNPQLTPTAREPAASDTNSRMADALMEQAETEIELDAERPRIKLEGRSGIW